MVDMSLNDYEEQMAYVEAYNADLPYIEVGDQLVRAEPLPIPDASEYERLNRKLSVQSATVTVGELTFDADEKSQDRMVRQLAVMDAETQWVLSDGSYVTVTKEQLQKALNLAVQNQNQMWSK